MFLETTTGYHKGKDIAGTSPDQRSSLNLDFYLATVLDKYSISFDQTWCWCWGQLVLVLPSTIVVLKMFPQTVHLTLGSERGGWADICVVVTIVYHKRTPFRTTVAVYKKFSFRLVQWSFDEHECYMLCPSYDAIVAMVFDWTNGRFEFLCLFCINWSTSSIDKDQLMKLTNSFIR